MCSYGAGDYFGERGLLCREPRAATVKAWGEGATCTCLKLGREAFEQVMQDTACVVQLRDKTKQYVGVVLGDGDGAAPAHGFRESFRESCHSAIQSFRDSGCVPARLSLPPLDPRPIFSTPIDIPF